MRPSIKNRPFTEAPVYMSKPQPIHARQWFEPGHENHNPSHWHIVETTDAQEAPRGMVYGDVLKHSDGRYYLKWCKGFHPLEPGQWVALFAENGAYFVFKDEDFRASYSIDTVQRGDLARGILNTMDQARIVYKCNMGRADALLAMYHAASLTQVALLKTILEMKDIKPDPDNPGNVLDEACQCMSGILWIHDYATKHMAVMLDVNTDTRPIADTAARFTAATGRPASELIESAAPMIDQCMKLSQQLHGRDADKYTGAVLAMAFDDLKAAYAQMLKEAPNVAAEAQALQQEFEGENNDDAGDESAEKDVDHGT